MADAQPPAGDAPTTPALGRLSVEQVASLLRSAGAQGMDAARIRADIAAGAPVQADGTIHLIAYGAWLVRTLAERERHG